MHLRWLFSFIRDLSEQLPAYIAATGRYKLLSSDAGKKLKNIITLMPFVGRLRS